MSLEKRNILRRTILAERDILPEDDQSDRSSAICGKLLSLQQVQNAQTIFIYMHFRSEVRTVEFIKLCLASGKTVTIPYTISDEKRLVPVRIHDLQRDVAPGFCGIPEPVPQLLKTAQYNPDMIDVAVIPGSVFDRAGGRFGYGGGYYDRFLTREAPRAFRIGLAYEIQLVERVPVQQHDQLMDLVVTEENIYDCRRNRHAQDSSLSS